MADTKIKALLTALYVLVSDKRNVQASDMIFTASGKKILEAEIDNTSNISSLPIIVAFIFLTSLMLSSACFSPSLLIRRIISLYQRLKSIARTAISKLDDDNKSLIDS
ncbi:hypothetical protein ISO77_17560 [Morganella morganii subsp. morganii]|uniref:hypothetical protein n=1 Tax=Morganella morganii TaxID=582 RepID=UPI001BDAB1C1|nr:hypothetical protein [Morganella morganii]MBT0397330.1 hypothetical protein [Morganella morganii subsp. morganii]